MANQYINKVIYGNRTLIDLTGDTVEAAKVLSGYTAHDKSGALITGTCAFDVDSTDGTAAVAEILVGKTAYAEYLAPVRFKCQILYSILIGSVFDFENYLVAVASVIIRTVIITLKLSAYHRHSYLVVVELFFFKGPYYVSVTKDCQGIALICYLVKVV